MAYRVKTPNPDYTGFVGKDYFMRGVSVDDLDESELGYYRRHGYIIEPVEALKPPGARAKKAEWQEFLSANGVEYDDADGVAELKARWDQAQGA